MENLTENVWRGIRQKLRRGEYPNRAPVGYLNETKSHTVIVDEAKAPFVRRLFEFYATDKYSASDLCELAKDWGLTSINGMAIRPNRMSTLLTDPFYVGMFRYRAETYEGAHAAIVPNSLFEQVQRIHKRRAGPEHERRCDNYPFLGLFGCGVCGGAITAESQKGHTYYRCTKKMGRPCHLKCIREEPFADALKFKTRAVSLPDDGAAAVTSIFDQWATDERTEAAAALNREQTRLADLETRLNRLLDVYLEGSLTRDEYAARKEQMLRDKADAKEKIGQIQTRGAIWLEPSREFVKRANIAEILSFSDDLAGIRDFLKIAGSNLKLQPPESTPESGKEDARAWPEESEAEPTEGRSSPRRGGFATHADFSRPEDEALSRPVHKSLPLNAAGNPSRPSVSVAASGKSSASLESSRLSPVGIAGHCPPLKLLGKAVPQIVVEFAEPWKSVAEIAPSREWSG